MNVNELLDRLNYDGERKGKQYKVHCPAHDDNTESLSVSEGKDGKPLIYCHAGCKFESVLAAVGLKEIDLSESASTYTNGNGSSKPSKASKPSKRISTMYDYRDEQGTLLYQVVRYDPKDFKQRQPDGKNGWIWSISNPPVRRVLYRLPELLAGSAADWVFLAEGERDCNNLGKLGAIATCNIGGAGKWDAAYTQALTGRRVCILPDNDQPGQDHAAKVMAALQGKAAEVVVLNLPGLANKEDVSDWITRGGTLAELQRLTLEAIATGTPEVAQAIESATLGKASAITAALAAMGYSFRLNSVRERIELANGNVLHDGEQADIIARLYDRGLTNKSLMETAMLADAWRNRYDPIQDFLNSLVWDGEDHIARLSYHFEDKHPLIEYPNGSKSTVFAAWLRRWLTGAVGKVRNGVQNPMLVLASGQGIGKSEFARWLCKPLPDYFVESAIDPDTVDHQRWATGNFIWEVGELGATTRKADVEALKAFITRKAHTYRVPYAKNEVSAPARASFIGTVNPDNAGFLTDPTGSRRFLTVEITAINWRGYLENVDVTQVWAQACALYKQDPTVCELDPTEIAIRDAINGDFNIDDPVQDAIISLFDITPEASLDSGAAFMSSADLAFYVGTQVKTTSAKSMSMDISRAMKKLNVTKAKRIGVNGYVGVAKKANLPT